MIDALLLAIAMGLPLAAVIIEFVFNVRLSERHHSHHDTYGMSLVMLGVFVMAMVLMGILGVVLSWLCNVGVFRADATIMLGFFSSFVLVMFIMWSVMRRYQVSTYDEYMEITPFLGRMRTIWYHQIERLRWSGPKRLRGMRSLLVIVGGHVAAVLMGTIDLDQIMLRINRNDVLENE